ncbi:hypothetical protein Scep_010767 [Stephania cephalantha]|uniref:Bifunctional inhibitor/plant lipid transfer protein/seed storage helical domain-containing protein n=1 Tax=Stephania cephalantha TaxID=152367 RepID=A0AAP0PHJ9_9MAGN
MLSISGQNNSQVAAARLSDDKCSRVALADFIPCKPAAPYPPPPNPPAPTSACCKIVKSHYDAGDLDCVCAIKGSTELPAFGVDPTLALQIPEKCGLPKLVCP